MMGERIGCLVETGWLQEHLEEPDLRVFDCTVILHPAETGWRVESGRSAWAAGHIPGSDFLDLATELSDQSSDLPFMMPPARQFAQAMSRHDIGEGTRVILYDANMNIWAARVWWMLRACGFDQAAVLDGGWHKWRQEGRPTSVEVVRYPPANFIARPRPALIAGKQEVLAALDEGTTCLIHCLSEESYRQARLPCSINIPYAGLVDPDTQAYLPLETLRERIEQASVASDQRVITYCRAGIAATSVALILHLLGVNDIAVYDGSLSEWLADSSLPVEAST